MIHKMKLALSGFALLASAGLVSAQSFPQREVNLIVNFGAGGATDVASRALAQGMEAPLGKPVIVQNKPGALGTLTPAYIAKQKPDGYQVGVVTYSTVAIMPHLMNLTYTIKDFEFVAGFGRFRYGVAVRADSPYQSIKDLVAASKAGKGIFFGAPSAPNNLAMFELGRVTGGKFEQISYKSGPETVTALLGGQVEVIVQNPSDILPHITSGKLRMLASASPMRWTELPNIPTMKEQGFDVEIDSWMGLAVPKGTPRPIVDKLQSAALDSVRSPEVAKRLTNLGVDPSPLTGKQYEDELQAGYVLMGKAIKAANLPRIN